MEDRRFMYRLAYTQIYGVYYIKNERVLYIIHTYIVRYIYALLRLVGGVCHIKLPPT